MRPALFGVPYDAASSFLRGAADAPARIRAALHGDATNTWSELGVDVCGPEGLVDAGDLALDDPESPGACRTQVADAVDALARRRVVPVILGGDHAVTEPAVRGLRRAVAPFSILHIDAHPDLYDEFNGNRWSHACPFARIMEDGLVSRLVQVGIRTMNRRQREQADRFGVDVIDMSRWARGDRPAIEEPVYLSIDLDGLDPAFAPGVSHPEPGGLSVRDVISLIHGCAGTVIGADIVELNPRQDPHGHTSRVAAKLVKELAGTILSGA